jgi:hypothetical protein
MKHARTIAAATLALVAGCAQKRETDPRMIAEWMHSLYGAVRVERLSPPVASRLFAYATVGLYSGLASANPKLPSLAGRLNGLASLPRGDSTQTYDETLTAVFAERVVLDSLFRDGLPTTRSALDRLADSLIAARAQLGTSDAIQARSKDLGVRVGLAIVAWSHGDGFDWTRGRPYVPPKGPGLWVNDAPVSTYATQRYLRRLIDSAAQSLVMRGATPLPCDPVETGFRVARAWKLGTGEVRLYASPIPAPKDRVRYWHISVQLVPKGSFGCAPTVQYVRLTPREAAHRAEDWLAHLLEF